MNMLLGGMEMEDRYYGGFGGIFVPEMMVPELKKINCNFEVYLINRKKLNFVSLNI